MDFFSWVVKKLLPWFMDLWEAWSIQLLVLVGLVFQLILAIFGSRRRFMTTIAIRFIVWASYLLSAYVATIALGRLTVIRINDPKKPHYDTELKALLAPLLLVLLGNPDTITAYSVEDNRLGVRQGQNLEKTDSSLKTFITEGWDVLGEARELANELNKWRDMWQVISCVWVEMICYAAYNCPVYHHAKLLRRGGDIITHVWLLLAHKTDKFKTSLES